MARKKIWYEAMSQAERLDSAGAKLLELEKRVRVAIALYENNKKFVFDEDFDRKVPPSEARIMFQFVQHTLVFSLILEICKIWDTPRDNRDSLPTIRSLLDDDAVINLQHERQVQRLTQFRNQGQEEQDEELSNWLFASAMDDDLATADRRRVILKKALPEIANISTTSEPLMRLREFRDRNIAHSLSDKPRKHDWPLYGDAGNILALTEPIVSDVMQVVHYGAPSWERSHQTYAEQAGYLWDGCTFSIDQPKPRREARRFRSYRET